MFQQSFKNNKTLYYFMHFLHKFVMINKKVEYS